MSGMAIIIADTAISVDAQGRYCLNDLHRAAGGEVRHRPSTWIQNQQTQALLSELSAEGASRNSVTPLSTVNDGVNNGTYVVREMVYAYAMWISPAFHLKVIRAYDRLANGHDQLQVPQTLPEALRLAADLADQNKALSEKVGAMAPKVEALDRIATSNGSLCLMDAAKTLQIQPKKLTQFLQEHQWIYRRPMGAGWLAYQDRIQSGHMEHKVTTGEKSDGSEWTNTQARITPKGVTKLSQMLAVKEAA